MTWSDFIVIDPPWVQFAHDCPYAQVLVFCISHDPLDEKISSVPHHQRESRFRRQRSVPHYVFSHHADCSSSSSSSCVKKKYEASVFLGGSRGTLLDFAIFAPPGVSFVSKKVNPSARAPKMFSFSLSWTEDVQNAGKNGAANDDKSDDLSGRRTNALGPKKSQQCASQKLRQLPPNLSPTPL